MRNAARPKPLRAAWMQLQEGMRIPASVGLHSLCHRSFTHGGTRDITMQERSSALRNLVLVAQALTGTVQMRSIRVVPLGVLSRYPTTTVRLRPQHTFPRAGAASFGSMKPMRPAHRNCCAGPLLPLVLFGRPGPPGLSQSRAAPLSHICGNRAGTGPGHAVKQTGTPCVTSAYAAPKRGLGAQAPSGPFAVWDHEVLTDVTHSHRCRARPVRRSRGRGRLRSHRDDQARRGSAPRGCPESVVPRWKHRALPESTKAVENANLAFAGASISYRANFQTKPVGGRA